MANQEHLEILERGRNEWNKWRTDNPQITPDLRGAILSGKGFFNVNLNTANLDGAQFLGSDLEETQFEGASMVGAILRHATIEAANFSHAKLVGANLERVDGEDAIFTNAILYQASLERADLWCANLKGANLERACLRTANLNGSNLENANLTKADLTRAVLTNVNLKGAILNQTQIYGLSAWDVKLDERTMQQDLAIVPPHLLFTDFTKITVDNLEVAQFIYLLLYNEKIRSVIDTLTSKVVLILGRFTEERKAVLDALREELRRRNFIPVLFDFDKPASKDVTGTVETLARMARFIIADLTDPSSIPHELATIVPFLRTTPVLPLRLAGSSGYSMFKDLRSAYKWVLETHEYENSPSLISDIREIIAPADKMADELRSLS